MPSKYWYDIRLTCESEVSSGDVADALIELPGNSVTIAIGGAHDLDNDLVCVLCGDTPADPERCCPVATKEMREREEP